MLTLLLPLLYTCDSERPKRTKGSERVFSAKARRERKHEREKEEEGRARQAARPFPLSLPVFFAFSLLSRFRAKDLSTSFRPLCGFAFATLPVVLKRNLIGSAS